MFDLMRIRFDQVEVIHHIKSDMAKITECDIIKRKI